jgi:predicted transposase/invertase (TIGR01784 family)
LREHFSDLLYRVRLQNGDEANVYLLLEHKSSPDAWVALQLLRYMVRIWERARQEKVKTLPPIIPVVVYHGRETWQVSENFDGLFVGPEDFRPYWPNFRYELQDLNQIDESSIQGNLLLRAALLTLMRSFDPNFPDRLTDIFKYVAGLPDRNMAIEFLQIVVIYVSVVAKDVTAEKVSNAIDAAFKDDGDAIMSGFVEELIEQGKQEGLKLGLEQGLEQGLERGLEQSILRVLVRRFNQVPAGIEARLQRMPVQKLELALDEALIATDLADFDQRLGVLEERP